MSSSNSTMAYALAIAAGIVTVAAACQSAVNLEVKYVDASTPDGGGDAEDPNVPKVAPGEPAGQELEGCPCDESQGLACCVSSVGPAFCTDDQERCNSEKGAFFRCFGPDFNSESVCCWNGSGAGALTALAADCKERPTACTSNKHCPAGQECKIKSCPTGGNGMVAIGACNQAPPDCPP